MSADLRSDPPTLRLEDPDDLVSLKVVVRPGRPDGPELADVLRPVGSLDAAGNALLDIDALKKLSGPRADDPTWTSSFDRMVDYACSKGWVGDGGRTLQAHCEWIEVG